MLIKSSIDKKRRYLISFILSIIMFLPLIIDILYDLEIFYFQENAMRTLENLVIILIVLLSFVFTLRNNKYYFVWVIYSILTISLLCLTFIYLSFPEIENRIFFFSILVVNAFLTAGKRGGIIFSILIIMILAFSFYSFSLNELNISKIEFFQAIIILFIIIAMLYYYEDMLENRNQELDKVNILLEEKIESQDKFIKNSIHEIHTPLSVMLLNSDMRERIYGKDEYSLNIIAAIKNIQNTYEDLQYIMKDKNSREKKSNINLKNIIEDRCDFFSTIVDAEDKFISFKYDDSIMKKMIYINQIDLERLIDNNISNAIKYSDINTTITISLVLRDNKLLMTFQNYGVVIKNPQKIFQRYFREDNVKGGYGIGLSIVNSICTKYDIEKDVVSTKKDGTTFKYKFKLHD